MRSIHARDSLLPGFSEAVVEAFRFLSSELGFRVTSKGSSEVRFETDRVLVIVYHDPVSLELGVQVGLLEDESRIDSLIRAGEWHGASIGRQSGEYLFGLEEVARLQGTYPSGRSLNPFVTSEQGIVENLNDLAVSLRELATPLLLGDELVFKDLSLTRSSEAVAFTHSWDVRAIRIRVTDAWRRQAYAKVAELLESIEAELTAAEQLKLDYARKHRGS